MKARPIIFSGPMVRALIEGRKTQTRRVVKGLGEDHRLDPARGRALREGFAWFTDRDDMPGNFLRVCPYGKPGDLLYVREKWAPVDEITDDPSDGALFPDSPPPLRPDRVERWRSSIHQPRWASRLTLQLTDVRVERIQEISNADAREEGIPQTSGEADQMGLNFDHGYEGHLWDNRTSAENFALLWESIHGPGAWERNDWVWALIFRVIHANVDDVLAEPERYLPATNRSETA